MKSILTSIQSYYVFLIIARAMGWKVEQEKTVEVRKNFPKAPDWDRKSLIYCSRDRRSFKRIPKEYQPLMAPFTGKVIGEFVCDCIDKLTPDYNPIRKQYFYNNDWENHDWNSDDYCLTDTELLAYGKGKTLYGWHISNLKIYDKPKELGEFIKPCECEHDREYAAHHGICDRCDNKVTRPPQSWCYVEKR